MILKTMVPQLRATSWLVISSVANFSFWLTTGLLYHWTLGPLLFDSSNQNTPSLSSVFAQSTPSLGVSPTKYRGASTDSIRTDLNAAWDRVSQVAAQSEKMLSTLSAEVDFMSTQLLGVLCYLAIHCPDALNVKGSDFGFGASTPSLVRA